jgi:hypothetical protein
MVLEIYLLVYLMEAWDPLLPPLGTTNIVEIT